MELSNLTIQGRLAQGIVSVSDVDVWAQRCVNTRISPKIDSPVFYFSAPIALATKGRSGVKFSAHFSVPMYMYLIANESFYLARKLH